MTDSVSMKLSSKERRRITEGERMEDLAVRRFVKRAADKLFQAQHDAVTPPDLRGAVSNRESRRVEGARLARERWARNKAERMALRRFRRGPAESEMVARKPVSGRAAASKRPASQAVGVGA